VYILISNFLTEEFLKGLNSILILTLLLIFSNTLKAQNSDEPRYDEFKGIYNKPYLNVGLLIQVVGDYQYERTFGTNGFNISNARLKLYGDFDKGIGYFLQTSFTKSPAILDAKVYYKLNDHFVFDAGLFKAPFSREFLTSAADIDFVNRSNVVSNLVPNRQIGLQVGGNISELNVNYAVGMFNGNRFANNANDNNRFMYVARLAYTPRINTNKAEFAVNIAQSNDNNVNIPSVSSNFSGERFLIGSDTRVTIDKILLSGEIIYGNFTPNIGDKIEAFGYQGTFGYMILNKLQALIRWDSYKPDKDVETNNQLILGLNFWPTKISELQFNYVIPTNLPIKNYQVLVNAQVSI
jgi:hypothetical protein